MSNASGARSDAHPCTYAREWPFGASECQRVLDPRVRDDFLSIAVDMFGIERSDRRRLEKFPGAVPCSLMRADLDLLRNRHYVALEKTDGTRYLLLVTLINRIPFCVLIDRNRTVRVVNLRFDASAHERSTLFDTELVQHADTGEWVLLVFDLIASGSRLAPPTRDRSVRPVPYTERMRLAADMVRNEWRPQRNTDAFVIRVKRFTALDQFEALRHAERSHNGFPTDGYVFVPVTHAVAPYRNRQMLKWKPLEQHTIDLRLHCRAHCFEFWMKDERDEPLLFAPVNRAVPRNERFLAAHGVQVRMGTAMIVECCFDTELQSWSIVRHRADKQEPNAKYTIERTLQNVRENITKDELFHVVLHERTRRPAEARRGASPVRSGGGGQRRRRDVPTSQERYFAAPPQPAPPPVQYWSTVGPSSPSTPILPPFPPCVAGNDPHHVAHVYGGNGGGGSGGAPSTPVVAYDPERPQYDAVPLNASLQRLVDKYIKPVDTAAPPATVEQPPPAAAPSLAETPRSPLHDMLENLRATLAREAGATS